MALSFLTICTPAVSDDEFILTPNAYSIFEGPNDAGSWTDFHVFAPISPRLIIVTRSCLLPSGFDEIEETRKQLLEIAKSMHIYPCNADSCLEDLPITKARNNYSRIVDGKVVANTTRLARDKHVFYLRFFRLGSDHVQRINMILLEEALDKKTVVFKAQTALRRALEFYLSTETPGFKLVVDPALLDSISPSPALSTINDAHDLLAKRERLSYLHLLQDIAQRLGSSVTAKYKTITIADYGPLVDGRCRRIYEKLGKHHTSLGDLLGS